MTRRAYLTDQALDAEIELLGEVLAGAAAATVHLTDEQVDELLQVTRIHARASTLR